MQSRGSEFKQIHPVCEGFGMLVLFLKFWLTTFRGKKKSHTLFCAWCIGYSCPATEKDGRKPGKMKRKKDHDRYFSLYYHDQVYTIFLLFGVLTLFQHEKAWKFILCTPTQKD
jgi:hypothetical protein